MTAPTSPDLSDLLVSWKLALQGSRKSAQTIGSYTLGARLYLDWCAANGHPPVLDRKQVQRWVVELMHSGRSPATARARLSALRAYSKWLAAEEELPSDPLLGIAPPRLDSKVVDALSTEELSELIRACKGKEFIDLRDEAVVRLFAETGMRARELLALTVDDLDLGRGLITVQRGKGGKGRIVPFGGATGTAVDRYLRRARRKHRLAHTSNALWLGGGGQKFGYHGLDTALKRRAELAGLRAFHIHQLRHTFASRWVTAQGSEGGLMAVAGWSSRQMVDRYTRSVAADRAAAEARRLNLGDI
ncbi:tyrosine-type recombinase/integrase [Mycobacterium colombiense]